MGAVASSCILYLIQDHFQSFPQIRLFFQWNLLILSARRYAYWLTAAVQFTSLSPEKTCQLSGQPCFRGKNWDSNHLHPCPYSVQCSFPLDIFLHGVPVSVAKSIQYTRFCHHPTRAPVSVAKSIRHTRFCHQRQLHPCSVLATACPRLESVSIQ